MNINISHFKWRSQSEKLTERGVSLASQKGEGQTDEQLSNPVRRQMLEILCSRKTVSPKEIAKELKMGVPAVYYHLDIMRQQGLVTKTSRGEYAATEKGGALCRQRLREEALDKSRIGQIAGRGAIEKILTLKVMLPAGIAIAALEFAACYVFKERPFFFGYTPLAAADPIPLYAYYLANLLLLFALVEGASYALTRSTGGELHLLGGIMISRLPLMVILLPSALGVSFWLTSATALAFGALFSLIALAFFTSLSKGIRIEIAIIISFVLLYFDIFVYPHI